LGTLVNQSTQREPGTPGRSSTARAAGAELHDRLRVHVAQRRVERGSGERPDLVDRLLDARLDDDTSLDDSEIATQLSTLLVGGAETLPKIIAGGLIRLAAHPQQRAELVAAPQLVQRAFEEVLRLEGVLQFVGRTATSEVTVAGTQVHPGQRVLLLLQSANRDEREFDEPDEFSIHRVSDRHLGFGHGVHFCIGAHPARLVGITLLQQLLARYPDYDVDLDAAERPPSEFQIGWTHLPLVGSPSTEPISG
jgi:cytochrome P450